MWTGGGELLLPGGLGGGSFVGAHVEGSLALGDALQVGLLSSEGGGGACGVGVV